MGCNEQSSRYGAAKLILEMSGLQIILGEHLFDVFVFYNNMGFAFQILTKHLVGALKKITLSDSLFFNSIKIRVIMPTQSFRGDPEDIIL